MTLFRYKKNGLLYVITRDHHGHTYRVHPYGHKTEIGIVQRGRYREFKYNMTMDDFEAVASGQPNPWRPVT